MSAGRPADICGALGSLGALARFTIGNGLGIMQERKDEAYGYG